MSFFEQIMREAAERELEKKNATDGTVVETIG